MRYAYALQPAPLRSPRRGSTVFAVRLYNTEVLARVKQNQTHPILSDRWAEAQTHEICADTQEKAAELAAEHFPRSEGFVVLEVKKVSLS